MSAESNNLDILDAKNFLKDVLQQSGKIAKKYFGQNFHIDIKEDESPVTIADREIETYIRERIRAKYPSYGICGEEFEDENSNSDIQFIIDPIDGTKAFISGNPTFGIMIGVSKKLKPIISGIYQPITKELWIGDNNKLENNSAKNDIIVKTLSKGILATTSYEYLTENGEISFKKLKEVAQTTKLGGDCYNYCKLVNGFIDVVMEENLKKHDYVALIPILKASGSTITDFKGNEITEFSKDVMPEFLVCRNEDVLNEIVALIN